MSSALSVLALLDVVGQCDRPVRVSDLARQLNVHRTRVHQQLITLVEAGWMQRNEDGTYQLTLRALHVGQTALRQAAIGDRLVPAMEELMHETGETVSLAILDHDAACIVQRVEPGQQLAAVYQVGTRLALDDSASGRVLVAFASEVDRQRLRARGIPIAPDAVLAQVREDGYSISPNSHDDGIEAIAAPLINVPGAGLITLSVVGPVSRFDGKSAVSAILRTSQVMNQILGGQQ